MGIAKISIPQALLTDYTVRPMVPSDLHEVLDLLRLCMPDSPVPKRKEFWEWKHWENPFGVSPALLALSEQKIIGLRVFMHWSWMSGPHKINAVRAVDTATHPDWQGKKIFSKLTSNLVEEMKTAGIAFIFNTPNRFSRPGYLKMGWKSVHKIPLWIRPLRPLRWIGSVLLQKQDEWDFKMDSNDSIPKTIQQPALHTFLDAWNDDVRFHTSRTVQYLKWRYSEIPYFSYYAKWRAQDSDFALLVFRKRNRKGFHELSISEFLISKNKRGIQFGKDLLTELAEEAGGDYIVATAAEESPERAALKESGFIHIGSVGPLLTVRPLNPVPVADPLVWSNWRFSIGDMEVF